MDLSLTWRSKRSRTAKVDKMKAVLALGLTLGVLGIASPVQAELRLEYHHDAAGAHGAHSPHHDVGLDRGDQELVNDVLRAAHSHSFNWEARTHPDWLTALLPIWHGHPHWFAEHYTCLCHHLARWELLHHRVVADHPPFASPTVPRVHIDLTGFVARWQGDAPAHEPPETLPSGYSLIELPTLPTNCPALSPTSTIVAPQELLAADSPVVTAPEPSTLVLVATALAATALVSWTRQGWKRCRRRP
jgi:hypothetical protein